MKGVILAAGASTRLRPITSAFSKVLIPVYDKPMAYYGVSLLISSGINDIAFVCSPDDVTLFEKLFSRFEGTKLNISYFVQDEPLGTAHSLKQAVDFIGDDDFVLLFGDCVYISNDIGQIVQKAIEKNTGLSLFAKYVEDPRRYGVLEIDRDSMALGIEEKPENPKTHYGVTGLYVFKNDAISKLKNLKKSPRGEYELTDIIQEYIDEHRARVEILPDDCTWLDTGTFDSLLDCANKVKEFEAKNLNIPIGCVELEMYRAKLLTFEEVKSLANYYKQDYKDRLLQGVLLELVKKDVDKNN